MMTWNDLFHNFHIFTGSNNPVFASCFPSSLYGAVVHCDLLLPGHAMISDQTVPPGVGHLYFQLVLYPVLPLSKYPHERDRSMQYRNFARLSKPQLYQQQSRDLTRFADPFHGLIQVQKYCCRMMFRNSIVYYHLQNLSSLQACHLYCSGRTAAARYQRQQSIHHHLHQCIECHPVFTFPAFLQVGFFREIQGKRMHWVRV